MILGENEIERDARNLYLRLEILAVHTDHAEVRLSIK